MVRGVPWDQLPNRYEPQDKVKKTEETPVPEGEIVPHKFNASKDLLEVGRRAMFGFVCGAMTGACFGLVEVLRDPVLMSGRKMAATNKVLKFTYLFAGFFGTYHGSRKVLQLSVPQSREANMVSAFALCAVPMVAVPVLRPLLPYGVMLVAIDAYSELSGPSSK